MQVRAEHGEEITESALRDMVYTEACVKEALRIRCDLRSAISDQRGRLMHCAWKHGVHRGTPETGMHERCTAGKCG